MFQNVADSRKRFIYRLIADWLKGKIWVFKSHLKIKMSDSLMTVFF